MISTIIKREMLEYLKSSKFLIGLIFTVILVVVGTLVNIKDFQQRQQDFLDAGKNAERSYQVEIFRQPQVLSTLVQGLDRKLGNKLEFTYWSLPYRTSGYMGFASQSNKLFSGFAAMDFAFVVRVVLSLLVIFLAYNSICEEKEKGTLKLALSNSIPRDKIILGKFAGGLSVILGSMTIAALAALLIMMIHPAISVTGDALMHIILMYCVSVLYLSSFYTYQNKNVIIGSCPFINRLTLI